jgi:hypothetical protein
VDGDQAGVLEDLQMLGDGLLGDVDSFGDLTDRAGRGPHEPQDLLAAGFGEGFQDILGADGSSLLRHRGHPRGTLSALVP